MNQRKTFEIVNVKVNVNVKFREKWKGKAFMEEVKTFQPKKFLQLPTPLHL